MSVFESRNIEIIGIASSVPGNKKDKNSFCQKFDENDIYTYSTSTGVDSVYNVVEHQTASDLGYAAAKRLIDELPIDTQQINILIYSSLSPDYRRPATAGVLQYRLGLPVTCCAFDVGLACSGFVYSQQVISTMLDSSDSKYALLIIAESPSIIVDQDNPMSMQFGDAGAAILYKKTSKERMETTFLFTEGSRFKTLIMPGGGFRDINPSEEKVLCSDGRYRSKLDVYTDGIDFFSFATRDVVNTVKEYLRYTNTSISDYDQVVLHQSNKIVLERFAKKLGIPNNKFPISLDEYGNTSGVSIPLTICRTFGEMNSDKEQQILAVGYGTGLSWGITSFSIAPNCIFPIEKTDQFFEEGIIDLNTM